MAGVTAARPATTLVAIALLAQATALPLLHGRHAGAAGFEPAGAATIAAGPVHVLLHDPATAGAPGHDPATCEVCAALARTGIALIGPTGCTPGLATTAGPAAAPPPARPATPALEASSPRAPPALVS